MGDFNWVLLLRCTIMGLPEISLKCIEHFSGVLVNDGCNGCFPTLSLYLIGIDLSLPLPISLSLLFYVAKLTRI